MGTLQLRIFLLFCGLLLAVEAVVLATIYTTMQQQVDATIGARLEVGRQVFLAQFDSRRRHLSVYSSVIGKDFGLLSTLHDDPRSLTVALDNQRRRVGADLAIITDPQGVVLAHTVHPELIGSRFELASDTFLVDGERAYQVVAAPLLAPTPIGRIYLGFAIDDALARQFEGITTLQVSFLVSSSAAAPEVVASSLSEARRAELGAANADAAAATPHSTTLGDEEFLSLDLALSQQPGTLVVARLQSSRDAALAAYRAWWLRIIEATIAALLLALVGALLVARGVVQPVRMLAERARAIARGSYSEALGGRYGGELGELVAAFGSMQAAVVERETSIRFLAYHDALTGLANRTRLVEVIDERIAGERDAEKRIAVSVIDLDRFKDINETLGYHAGDRLLRDVAQRLVAAVGTRGLVARLGGNEFGVMLDGLAIGEIQLRQEQLYDELLKPFQAEGLTLNITAGIGTAVYPDHGADALTLLRHADAARFAAKERHLRYMLYDGAQDRYSLLRVSLLGELRAAIERGDLLLHYQPKLELKNRTVVSAEALVRWQHPNYGLIPPSEFIPMVEHTGNIQMLTLWVMREALRQAAEWAARGIVVQIAVNVSAHDLRYPGLVEGITQALRDSGAGPRHLMLEITESAVVDESAPVIATLDALHALGLDLAIDDYGTGYSSLSRLKRLPVDELKIDQSFVAAIDRGADDLTIVRSTIDLGHNMGLRVTAEGVETERVMELLAEHGCDVAQGYHISRPLPAAQFEKWLQARGPRAVPKENNR